jgi:hypothetical protein
MLEYLPNVIKLVRTSVSKTVLESSSFFVLSKTKYMWVVILYWKLNSLKIPSILISFKHYMEIEVLAKT